MLRFQPAPGTILHCDFTGYIVPEIVKARQVVVLWKHKTNAKLVYVVPLSSTPPHDPSLAHQLSYIPIARQGQTTANTTIWVKCDLIYTVSTDRLSMPVNRSRRSRAPININISTPDYAAVKACVCRALRLP